MNKEELNNIPPTTAPFPFLESVGLKRKQPYPTVTGGSSSILPANKQLRTNLPQENLVGFRWNLTDVAPQQARKESKVAHDLRHREKCWFCLANSEVEKHLLFNVHKECYLSLAKGGLTADHVLIVSVDHYINFTKLPLTAQEEVVKYKEALKKFYNSQDKIVLIYEVYRANARVSHFHCQVIPLSNKVAGTTISKDRIQQIFKSQKLSNHIIGPNASLYDVVGEENYFYLELPSGEKLVHIQSENERVDSWAVVCMVLGYERKIEWTEKLLPINEEKRLVDKLKEQFKPFAIPKAEIKN